MTDMRLDQRINLLKERRRANVELANLNVNSQPALEKLGQQLQDRLTLTQGVDVGVIVWSMRPGEDFHRISASIGPDHDDSIPIITTQVQVELSIDLLINDVELLAQTIQRALLDQIAKQEQTLVPVHRFSPMHR